jgi:hypothetical protein
LRLSRCGTGAREAETKTKPEAVAIEPEKARKFIARAVADYSRNSPSARERSDYLDKLIRRIA